MPRSGQKAFSRWVRRTWRFPTSSRAFFSPPGISIVPLGACFARVGIQTYDAGNEHVTTLSVVPLHLGFWYPAPGPGIRRSLTGPDPHPKIASGLTLVSAVEPWTNSAYCHRLFREPPPSECGKSPTVCSGESAL